MKIIDVVQGSQEWLAARAGIVTASEMSNLMTDKFEIRTGKTPETYLLEKLAERVMGAPLETGGSSWHMEQGSVAEHEARGWVSFTQECEINKVGLVVTDDFSCGASPDGLIGEDGGVEIKYPSMPVHLKYLLGGILPTEHALQVHSSMWVTGRKWWLFVSYCRFAPPLVVRVEREDKIQALIGEAVAAFNVKLADAYAKMKALAREEDPRPLPPTRQFRPLIF